jgi:predicted PurR-regulated permease PerM
MMLIALFFLLRDGRGLIEWFMRATPLAPERVREMMREFRTVARSVLGANFITGGAQAVIATIGYFIGHAPSPIFFGLLTLFASLIPSVGTALITLPVAGLVLLLGHPWAALFLALWGAFVVGLIDNFLRPLLIRGGGHLHGALIFFSLIGAMSAFGAIGVFLGPLALVFFLAVVRTRRRAREALEHEPVPHGA